LVRAKPNLRYTPRERPVIEQRFGVAGVAPASRGWRCSSACAAWRSSAPVLGLADQLLEFGATGSVFLRDL